MISSESNAQIKELIKLQRQAKQRKKTKSFVVEGYKLLEEAAEHNLIKKIYISESASKGFLEINGFEGREPASELLDFGFGKYLYEIVDDVLFRHISETVTPQGILGIVKMPLYNMEDLLSDEKKAWVLLDGIQDPGNLGTIMRTAEGAGMSGIIMGSGCVDLFNPKVVRSTMGAIYRVPFVYVDDLVQTVEEIKNMGCSVYGASMEQSVIYDEPDYMCGTAIVIGNEANGISDRVLSAMTAGIRIPMEGRLESLNAAVSAAVIMYEVARQRRAGQTRE